MKKTLTAVMASVMVLPFAATYSSAAQVNVKNISGNDRYSTAVSISKNGWASGSKSVILVNGKAVADSLSVAPLASRIKAPVLLTEASELKQVTHEEINRLKPENIFIIGGEGSVSSKIERELASSGYKVERISGSTRIETSVNIAKRINSMGDAKSNRAFLVNGMTGLADAAGIGAIAAKNMSPIVFTDKNSISSTKRDISDLGIDYLYLIGGKSSLPGAFEGIVPNVERISGSNRQETNTMIINRFYKNPKTVYVANDGSSNSSALIDSVLINAGIIASNSEKTGDVNIIPSVQGGENTSDTENGKISDGIVLEEKNIEDNSKDDNNANSEKITEVSSEQQNKSDSNDAIKVVETERAIKKDSFEEDDKDDISAEPSVSEDNLKQSGSNLDEGAVMIASPKNGFSYSQMKVLNGEGSNVSSVIQVSGARELSKHINDIADFMSNRGNPAADQAFKKILGYEYIKINYNVGGKISSLNGKNILNMINSGSANNFRVDFDRQKIRNFVSSIDLSGLGGGDTDNYAFISNNKVRVARAGTVYKVDVDRESANLLERLKSEKTYNNLSPQYIKTQSVPANAKRLGGNYVQIDLNKQHMWVYNNNRMVVSTPIVSGNPNKGSATPPGIFKINKKMRNVVLRGPGYASPVKYWIPFNGSIGIHDSYWQSAYGGKRYLYAGSHGCINTPLNQVGILYNNVRVGTPVIVQK